MIHAKIKVFGTVQSVGFRYFTYINAVQIGLNGFVKNMYDGSVYCEVEGTSLQIETLCDFLKQGPSRSYVQKIEIEYCPYTGIFQHFEIK